MKIKKTCFSTRLSDLYGRDGYQSHIKVGQEYWYYFAGENKISDKYGNGWYKIKVTYIRSGCMFYIFPDYPDIKEDFCPINCFMTSTFVLAELDPIRDLKGLIDDIDSDAAKIKYCFDDEYTVVKNWPNEKEVDINEDELYQQFVDTVQYILIKMLEVKE